MYIYPAIDIINGKCVRLTKGDYNACEVLDDSPLNVAKEFYNLGATRLHIVDLDGAKNGQLSNYSTIAKIATSCPMFIEVGGGIRDEKRIEQYINAGVSRIILGTIAIKDFDFVKKMVAKYKDKIAVGIDCKNGYVAINGWQDISNISGFDFAVKCRNAGVSTIIYTDIDTDGAMKGTNMNDFCGLNTISGLNIIASGGVSFKNELFSLKKLGIEGVILGKSLYHGLLNLKETLEIARGEL